MEKGTRLRRGIGVGFGFLGNDRDFEGRIDSKVTSSEHWHAAVGTSIVRAVRARTDF